jgi:hypothetical protein
MLLRVAMKKVRLFAKGNEQQKTEILNRFIPCKKESGTQNRHRGHKGKTGPGRIASPFRRNLVEETLKTEQEQGNGGE